MKTNHATEDALREMMKGRMSNAEEETILNRIRFETWLHRRTRQNNLMRCGGIFLVVLATVVIVVFILK